MKSGDTRPSRGRSSGPDPIQGSLDGILPADPPVEEPRKPPHEKPRGERRRTSGRQSAATAGATREGTDSAAAREAEPLRASLDRLEENVTLLLARHAEVVAERAEAAKRRAERESLDPLELQDRVRTLEEERERLDRHAEFLEERIRGLLSRVRYVVES